MLCLLYVTAALVWCNHSAQVKYILFNRTPGSAWSQNNPSSITPEFLNEVNNKLDLASSISNHNLYIGQEFVISLFETPLSTLLETLHAIFNASVATKIPISLELDGENWWQSSNLYNFYNKSETGYNSNNKYNVERYGWDISNTVEIGWRNWGSQIRVIPQQNVLSPQVMNKLLPILKSVGNSIKNWYENTLIPLNMEYLLSTIKIGWEAGVQYNAYYYANGNSFRTQNAKNDPKYGLNFTKGLSGGLPLLGYAAANASGLFKDKMIKNETLNRYDISNITKLYMDILINTLVNDVGIDSKLIGNHVGGQYYPYENTVPFASGFTQYGVPGYSVYTMSIFDAMKYEMDSANRIDWIAGEWWLSGGSDTQKWYNNFNITLNWMNCRSMAVYNWDNDFENYPAGIEAVQLLVKTF